MRSTVFSALTAILLAGVFAPASAQSVDPHALYEEKCAGCHLPHAGDFVHDSIVIENGVLAGRKSGAPVGAFLERGHGRLTAEEIGLLLDHFLRIGEWGRLYHDKCLICHDPASHMARSKLILRDGALWGRYTGRDIAAFLAGHGRLQPDEIAPMLDMLIWQLETAAGRG